MNCPFGGVFAQCRSHGVLTLGLTSCLDATWSCGQTCPRCCVVQALQAWMRPNKKPAEGAAGSGVRPSMQRLQGNSRRCVGPVPLGNLGNKYTRRYMNER